MTELMLVKEDQEDFLNQLIETKGENLPATLDELLPICAFTELKAKAWKIMSDKIKGLESHKEMYEEAIRSGQKYGIAALYEQKRMGEITRDMPKDTSFKGNQSVSVTEDRTANSKISQLKSKGISRDTYSDAERIAANPEILERVIESSKERGEIPTKTSVLNAIKMERHKEKYPDHRQQMPDINRATLTIVNSLSNILVKVKELSKHKEYIEPVLLNTLRETAVEIANIFEEESE